MKINYDIVKGNDNIIYTQTIKIRKNTIDGLNGAIRIEITNNYKYYTQYADNKKIAESELITLNSDITYLNMTTLKFIKRYFPYEDRIKNDRYTIIELLEE